MKRTLKLDLPTTDSIATDLEQLTCYPALTEAEQQLAASEAALADARQALDDATTAVDELPAKVRTREAVQDDLERAISAQRATELMIPHHEQALADAQEGLAEAKLLARAAVVEEGRRRRDVLQGVADEISPVLEQLREVESALHEALRANAPEPVGDPVALSKARKLAPPLDPVRWAVSRAVTNRLRAGGLPNVEVEIRR